MQKVIPERIEAGGVSMEKDVLWTAIGFAVGKNVAGIGGGMIGALTQGNMEILNVRCQDSYQSSPSYQPSQSSD